MTGIAWEGDTLRISNSEAQCFKDCRRRWFLSYYRELDLKPAERRLVGPRELGIRVHHALHMFYTENKNPLKVLDQIYHDDIMSVGGKLEGDEYTEFQKEQELAKIMVGGFMDWREEEGIDDGMELIAAETVVETPSPVPGVNLRGKLDQRWHRKVDGAKLFRDWKTTGDLTTLPRLAQMDEQAKFYHLLEHLEAQLAGDGTPQWRTDGAQIVMLRKVKRTATAKPPFYGVYEVHHNKAELRSMWYRVLKVIEEIVTTRQALDAGSPHEYQCPPRPSRDCTWACDYEAVCSLMDDGSNWEGILEEYYTHVDPHERYVAEDTKGAAE